MKSGPRQGCAPSRGCRGGSSPPPSSWCHGPSLRPWARGRITPISTRLARGFSLCLSWTSSFEDTGHWIRATLVTSS